MSALASWFERPGLLALLALPALAWWLTRRPRRPVEVPTGTAAIWREVSREPPAGGARASRRPPLAVLLALALGAVAVAGPRAAQPPRPVWRVVFDRSPSMYLPHEAGGTRLEQALARLPEVLPRAGSFELRWLASDGAGLVERAGDEPPPAWRAPPPVPHPEPAWTQADGARTVWVTDAPPPFAPRAAAAVWSGGAAVAGPAAVDVDGTLLVYGGADAPVLSPGQRAPARFVAVGQSVPEPVRALVEAWAAERGLDLCAAAPGDGPGAALVVTAPVREAGLVRERVALWRDGWGLEVEALPGGLAHPGLRAEPAGGDPVALVGTAWLEQAGAVHVRAGPGLVELSFDRAGEPSGDRAAFAVSLARLLDGALLPPPGVVPVAERLAAGPGGVAPARGPQGVPPARPARAAWPEALLAAAAALLVLGSALAGAFRTRSRSARGAA